jgi:hypothetical protein
MDKKPIAGCCVSRATRLGGSSVSSQTISTSPLQGSWPFHDRAGLMVNDAREVTVIAAMGHLVNADRGQARERGNVRSEATLSTFDGPF